MRARDSCAIVQVGIGLSLATGPDNDDRVQWPACFQGDWCQVFSCYILAVSSPLSISNYCHWLYLFQQAAHSVLLAVNVRLTLTIWMNTKTNMMGQIFHIVFACRSQINKIKCFPSVIILCRMCVSLAEASNSVSVSWVFSSHIWDLL